MADNAREDRNISHDRNPERLPGLQLCKLLSRHRLFVRGFYVRLSVSTSRSNISSEARLRAHYSEGISQNIRASCRQYYSMTTCTPSITRGNLSREPNYLARGYSVYHRSRCPTGHWIWRRIQRTARACLSKTQLAQSCSSTIAQFANEKVQRYSLRPIHCRGINDLY